MDTGDSSRPKPHSQGRELYPRRHSPAKSPKGYANLDAIKALGHKALARKRRAHLFTAMTDKDRHALAEEAIKSGKVQITKCPPMASYL